MGNRYRNLWNKHDIDELCVLIKKKYFCGWRLNVCITIQSLTCVVSGKHLFDSEKSCWSLAHWFTSDWLMSMSIIITPLKSRKLYIWVKHEKCHNLHLNKIIFFAFPEIFWKKAILLQRSLFKMKTSNLFCRFCCSFVYLTNSC